MGHGAFSFLFVGLRVRFSAARLTGGGMRITDRRRPLVREDDRVERASAWGRAGLACWRPLFCCACCQAGTRLVGRAGDGGARSWLPS
ncbi:MAG TPA: hypothetical protein VFV38_18660 [Ktedonobacteraceae bacterium]|nr:hypothetical protein [Ktedonobacteraceae bacterium]